MMTTAQESLLAAFRASASSIKTGSPLKELFVRVGENDAAVTELSLSEGSLNTEMVNWLPARQDAALWLLKHNAYCARVDVNGCKLGDSSAFVLAEVCRASRSLTWLSAERNDLREAGLIALAKALSAPDCALRELRIMHQSRQIPTSVEEALVDSLTKNTTLLKLGLVVRNDVPRRRIEAALARNVDQLRQLRRLQSSSGGSAMQIQYDPMARASSADAPKRRPLSAQYSDVAQRLNEQLKPFDHAALTEAVRRALRLAPKASVTFHSVTCHHAPSHTVTSDQKKPLLPWRYPLLRAVTLAQVRRGSASSLQAYAEAGSATEFIVNNDANFSKMQLDQLVQARAPHYSPFPAPFSPLLAQIAPPDECVHGAVQAHRCR